MNSIDEEIARTEANIKICEDNVNKFIVEKTLAQNELFKLKQIKSENERRKERNANFKFAIELLEFAIQRNDANACKVGWMAIEKIRNAISDINTSDT